MHFDRDISDSTVKNVMIVAGEASGDLHGSNLVKAMLDRNPDIRFYGVGGERLKKAGVEIVADSADMAVVGLTEVLSKLNFILKIRRKLKESLQKSKPDLLILIDYPDFNMPLAKIAKRNGVKVFYYISPQVWAWRKRRIYYLGKHVDKMAVIIPFEKEIYDGVDLDVTFVGHPLLDDVRGKYSKAEAVEKFGLEEGGMTVGILPGSRNSEVTRILPEMLKAAEILRDRLPSLQFILPLADTLEYRFVSAIIDRSSVDVKIVHDHVYDVIGVSDAVMVASGTATLETALMETPMIVVYKVSPFSYFMGRIFIHVDHIGMVNIIAGKTVAPEFIQYDARAGRMADEIYDILTDETRRDQIRRELKTVRKKLGTPGGAERAAGLAFDLLYGENGVK